MVAFAFIMLAGLAGMVMMALPGLGHRGHISPHATGHLGHGVTHVWHGGHGPSHSAAAHAATGVSASRADSSPLALLPSPRVVFTLMTLFGAFGYALAGAAQLPIPASALLAVVPALLVERWAVSPLWRFLFRFEGTPSTSLDNLALSEATAVTPFHNGRGLVSVVHDGRALQLRAELCGPQIEMPVRVGDVLFVENVDVPHERITVSVR